MAVLGQLLVEPVEQCQGCKFWEKMYLDHKPDIGLGECRRQSPLDASNLSGRAVWPQTCAEDWCGEFVARRQTVSGPPPLQLKADTTAFQEGMKKAAEAVKRGEIVFLPKGVTWLDAKALMDATELIFCPQCCSDKVESTCLGGLPGQPVTNRAKCCECGWKGRVRELLTRRQVEQAQTGQFVECASCAAKPGSPRLCDDCIRRRSEASARPDSPAIVEGQ